MFNFSEIRVFFIRKKVNLKRTTQTFTFKQNGHEIRSEGECKVCTCEDSGEMTCADMTCPELHCGDDELISYREGVCCPYCLSDWVEVC